MVTEQNGHAIFWRGHLCEGDRMIVTDPDSFILWTGCGLHAVPPARAHDLRMVDEVTCVMCQEFLH